MLYKFINNNSINKFCYFNDYFEGFKNYINNFNQLIIYILFYFLRFLY